MDLLVLFLLALATALATGLGALPFLAGRRIGAAWIGRSDALAAGLMGAASVFLLGEGAGSGPWHLAAGAALGAAFAFAGKRWLDRHEIVHLHGVSRADAARILLVMGVMTLHSFTEGIALGVSFAGGQELGIALCVAIAVHNVPEGLAIALVMVPKGISPWAAAGWGVFSSLPQPLLAVPAYLVVTRFEPLLPIGMGLAAGAMLYVAAFDLLAEARRHCPAREWAPIALLGAAAMAGFTTLLPG